MIENMKIKMANKKGNLSYKIYIYLWLYDNFAKPRLDMVLINI